jgi:hypothetical protein
MGHEVYVRVRVGDVELVTRFPPRSGVRPHDRVDLTFDPRRIHLFDTTTEGSLLGPAPHGAGVDSATAAARLHA